MLKQIIVVIFVLVTSISVAQEGTTSPYSFYGIGTLKFKGTAENRAMGGLGVFSDSIHLNLQNPAAVADLRLINYTVGASFKQVSQKTETEQQNTHTTSLDYLAIGVPMGRFGANFGIIPYTSVGYDIQDIADDRATQFTGRGGLNRAFVTLGYNVMPGLNVGVDVNYNFGNIRNTAITQQEDVEFATRESNRSDLLGFSFNLGAMYKTMVTDDLQLSTSITYTPETDFKAENTRNIGTIRFTSAGSTSIDIRDIDVADTDFTFPSQYTIGAGIGKPKNWFVGLEYTDQKTSNFNNRTFEVDNVTFNDASKFRAGGFYIPNYNAIGNYFQRVVYRAGARFEETGININGEDINEFGISFGVGLPVGRIFSNINVGFEVGRRGTKSSGLVQENFFNAFLSLSLNDRWFEKRYYD